MSPTQRALAYCRKNGWTAQVVERRVPRVFTTIDLFGCIDIIVMDGQPGGPLGVQVTSGNNAAARLAKIAAEPRMAQWLASPARLQVWAWRKVGPRGKRKLWEVRVIDVRPEDINHPVVKESA